MRKTLLSIFLLCILTSGTDAQITINKDDFPQVNYLVVRAVDDVTTVDPGQAGLNQSWDFSNLIPITYDSTYYESPAGFPGYENYPDANVVSNHNPDSFVGGYNVNFWKYTDTEIKAIADETLINIWGTIDMALHIRYIPPTGMSLPMNYGDIRNKIFAIEWFTAVRNEGVTTDSMRMISHVNMNYQVDASGNMILPDGSFPVLRVKTAWSSIDSSFIWQSGNWVYDSDTTSNWTQYNWYANDFGEVGIYRIDAKKGNGFTFFKSSTLVGVDEKKDQISMNIYPNPVSTNFVIDTKWSYKKIEILDLSGRVLMTSEFQQNPDVSWLNSGIYFVRISDEKNNLIRKFYKL